MTWNNNDDNNDVPKLPGKNTPPTPPGNTPQPPPLPPAPQQPPSQTPPPVPPGQQPPPVPPGGYGPPPAHTPPPIPPGGYGQQPPVPPGGYGPPPASFNMPGLHQEPGKFAPGQALSQSWALFKRNWLIFITPVIFVMMVNSIAPRIFGRMEPVPEELVGSAFWEGVYSNKQSPVWLDFLTFALLFSLVVVLARGFHIAAEGKKVALPDMFKGVHWLVAVPASFLACAASWFGLLGCVVGIVFTWAIFQFVCPALALRHSFTDSFRHSFTWSFGNFGNALGVAGLSMAVGLGGIAACCIGIIPAYAIAVGLVTCAYRQAAGLPTAA